MSWCSSVSPAFIVVGGQSGLTGILTHERLNLFCELKAESESFEPVKKMFSSFKKE